MLILRERLWNRQSGLCVICRQGVPLSDNPFLVVDHTHPVVQYAASPLSIEKASQYANDEGNLALVDKDCNGVKNAWDLEEFHQAIKCGEISFEGEQRTYTQAEIERERRLLSEKGRTGGRIGGRRAAESGQLERARNLPQTKLAQIRNASIQGRKNVESGHWQKLLKSGIGGKFGGPIGGRKNVESGQIQALGRIQGQKNTESGWIQALGRAQGRIQGRKAVESGHLARIRPIAGRVACHRRWHVQRGIKNPACALCAAA